MPYHVSQNNKHGFGKTNHTPKLKTDFNSFRIDESTPPIVSVERARRVLGYHASQLSDDQVINIIHTLQLLAREQLGYNGSKKEVSSYEYNSTDS